MLEKMEADCRCAAWMDNLLQAIASLEFVFMAFMQVDDCVIFRRCAETRLCTVLISFAAFSLCPI